METRFLTPFKDGELHDKLMELTQNESLKKYIARFHEIYNKLGSEVTEEEKFRYFKRGVSENIKFEIMERKANTYEKAVLIAQQYIH